MRVSSPIGDETKPNILMDDETTILGDETTLLGDETTLLSDETTFSGRLSTSLKINETNHYFEKNFVLE